MRHLHSEALGDFAAIYDSDVELINVARPETKALTALAEQLSTDRQVVAAQWQQAHDDADATLRELSPHIEEEGVRALNEEILELGDVLHTLLGCERIGVRLATLNMPMCPRFHVDQIPCRLLSTISGPATQWIPNDDVDRDLFANRNDDTLPVRPGKTFQQLSAGSWALLKGGSWDDSFSGVVHRSPHQSDERLLLSLDPIFNS